MLAVKIKTGETVKFLLLSSGGRRTRTAIAVARIPYSATFRSSNELYLIRATSDH